MDNTDNIDNTMNVLQKYAAVYNRERVICYLIQIHAPPNTSHQKTNL